MAIPEVYFKIYTNGKVVFQSKDIRNTNPQWADEEFKKISGIDVVVPRFKKVIRFIGFEAYNFFIEATQGLAGGTATLESVFFCGSFKGAVSMIKITNKAIEHFVRDWGSEYYDSPTKGWKIGVLGNQPELKLGTI